MGSKKLYGLLGKSLTHSFSQAYFTKKFMELDVNAEYKNFEIESIQDLPNLLDNNNLAGLNVTNPYKEVILEFLDELSEEAKAIGAVNTILFRQNKKIGFNTDVYGFHQMIKPFLLNTHEKALVIGNGGASKAVVYVLKSIGIEVLIAARNPKFGEFHIHEINDLMVKFCGLIVHTTPVGTFPNIHDCLEFPFSGIGNQHLVVDLIYNPETTKFLEKAKEQGATTLNGLTMLYQQAEQSWNLWNQKE